jgi:nucleotide-binding universal stress UspA family protein
MKNNYKILVLSDLKGDTTSMLKSSVRLAQMIGGSIEFFHVKSPTEIVENDNQLSANRAVNKEFIATDNKVKNLRTLFSQEYNADINFKFSFGNVKNEIEKRIDEYAPDVVVLGKRKVKPLRFIGGTTEFILKKHSGTVMIASHDNGLEPNKEISLGVLNGSENSFSMDFSKELLDSAEEPLKSFQMVKSPRPVQKVLIPTDKKVLEYVFEHNDSTVKNLSKYVSKNNINLLCINRAEKKSNIASDISGIVEKLNVSLLIAN